MKKGSFINIFISSFLIFCSCSKNDKGNEYLSVTIEPQRFFLEQIVKDKYPIKTLIPTGSNPESYDPTPSQMVVLENSKAYFKLGYLGIENILLDKIKTKDSLIIKDCSTDINIIKEHNHNHDDDHNHTHMDGHDLGDPHYWTSSKNAKIILKNILDGMLEIDPANGDFYNLNYKKAINSVDSLEYVMTKILDNSSSQAFIIYHPALSYYAADNSLKQFSIEQDGKNPSPMQLKNVVDSGIVNKVKVVFVQKEFDVKNALIIAEQIKADTCSVDLLSYDWPATMMLITKQIAQ